MASLPNLLGGRKDKVHELDAVLARRLEKGRNRHNTWKPIWAESLAFYQGRHFVYRDATSNRVAELETREWGSKPRYRARTARNRVLGYVVSEVSAGTSRVPQYEVVPATTDQEDVNAAQLGEKVLLALYDRLELRKHLVDAYLYSVTCGEGFIRPFWHPEMGDELPDDPENPTELLREGDIAVEVYGPHEVYWEPGCRFEESKWHAIEKARSIEEIKKLPGYNGAELRPDVSGHTGFVQGQLSKAAAKGDMVMVTEYLELPSQANESGRRFYCANNQQITATEAYPMLLEGGPCGYRPALLCLSYFPTPDRDRDMGMVENLIDAQRTLNDIENKRIEWKNLAIAPQILAPVGSLQSRATTEPGAVVLYNPVGGQTPQWREVPEIPQSLEQMRMAAIDDMEEISGNRDLPARIDSARAVAAVSERDAQRRAFIVQKLADFHSSLGHMLLSLVQQHYDEPRTLKFVGRRGLDYITDFKGASLRDNVDVRVMPGSIEPRTRAAVLERLMLYADRGWISGEQVMKAAEGGYVEDLLDDYELDVAKQEREIQQMIAMGNEQVPGGDIPIPQHFDNSEVHLGVLHRWMKTRDFEMQPPQVQEAAVLHAEAHEQILAEQQAQAEQAMMEQAEQYGEENAARPRSKGQPDKPLPGGEGAPTEQ